MSDLALLNALVALEIACFSPPWSEKMLSELMLDPKYLVVLERDTAGEALGYLIGWRVGSEAELARIGVVDSQRGRGWGKKLIASALENWKAGGVMRVFLEVRASNSVAGRLYLSSGFAIVGKRPGYYSDGEDAILMALDLS